MAEPTFPSTSPPEEKRMGENPFSCFSLGVGIASSRLKTWYLARHFAHLRGSAYFKGFQYHVDDSLTGQHIPANNRCGFCRVEHTCRRDYHLHWRQTALIAKKRIKKRAESLSFSFSCICLYFKGQGIKKNCLCKRVTIWQNNASSLWFGSWF